MRNIVSLKNIIFLIILGVIGYFTYTKLFSKDKISHSLDKKIDEEYTYDDPSIKDDSLTKLGFCVNTNFVITEDADVRRTPNKAMYNSIYKLKYGTKIYTKNIDENSTVTDVDKSLLDRETVNNFVAIYAEKPVFLSDKPVGFMNKEDFIERSQLKDFKPKQKFNTIDFSIKSSVASNLDVDGESFGFSLDATRFNNCLTYGDFNNDGAKDFAVVLDNEDNSKSAIEIYLKNTGKNSYDLAYKKAYNTLLKIKTINRNSNVMVNSENTTFPFDGILITDSRYDTYFHIYNNDNKSFMVLRN